MQNKPEYDLGGWRTDPLAPSENIIHGVTKHSVPIELICRPSDSNFIRIHDYIEIEYLRKENYELWADNGARTPQLVTIGKLIFDNNLGDFRFKN